MRHTDAELSKTSDHCIIDAHVSEQLSDKVPDFSEIKDDDSVLVRVPASFIFKNFFPAS